MSRIIRTSVLNSAARTTSGQQEIPLTNDHGNFAVLINVTAATGTSPTCVFSIEDSADGTTWFPVKANAAITAVGQYRVALTPLDGPTQPRIRLHWVIGGTTPSFTFTAIGVTRPSMMR